MFHELNITVCANTADVSAEQVLGNCDLTEFVIEQQLPVSVRQNQLEFQKWRLRQNKPIHLVISLERPLLQTLVATLPATSVVSLDDYFWRSGWFHGLTATATDIKLLYKGSWYTIKQRYKGD